MNRSLRSLYQRWGDTLKFCLWGLLLSLACYLLVHVLVNRDVTHLVPLSVDGRDSLLTVHVPREAGDTLVRREAFAVHFNRGRGIANCAEYELLASELHGAQGRAGEFARDPGVTGCPDVGDYAGSGMDRGHLVPAADLKWSPQAMRQSFLLTNVCPMHKALNEGGWAKLEEKVREWVVRDSALLVIAGPIVIATDTTLASGKVTVPSRYFKVVMAPCVRPMRAIAFIYPNGPCGGRLREYAVSVDEVERQTGLDFFPLLPSDVQQRLESPVNLDAWLN